MIRSIFSAIIIVVMALAPAGLARAQTTGDKYVWITGFGVQSCGKLLSWAPGGPEADAITYNAALSWIDGYLSGANTARWEGKQRSLVGQGTDPQSRDLWITSYCRAHPLDALGKAASSLDHELMIKGQ
jgi:hypothetical protein